MVTQRPRFEPSSCENQLNSQINSPLESADGSLWTPVLGCPANFPPELFAVAVLQLVNHPEYNSTLILRSETVSTSESNFPSLVPQFDAFRPNQTIHRRLLPRRPERDGSLEQYCTFYGHRESTESLLVVLSPVIADNHTLPYYHPTVTHLAFRYIPSAVPPLLRIEALPFPGTPVDPNSRLYRTCLALLETVHRYGWGAMTNYKKRVHHDVLVSREAYQDLYLVMRERHKHLVDSWQEVTDPLKHVFEDIGIASYLMLLWKDMFWTDDADGNDADSEQPWHRWPRPGGFLDFGCGNGLLTHILTSEGYQGRGIDLRARKSWEHYPESTRARLFVHAFDPLTSSCHDLHLLPGSFIIGNHADELTPWIPILATQHRASGYLSIPCCAWNFDERFDRSNAFSQTSLIPMLGREQHEKLNLGTDGSNASNYSMYRIWLASLSLHCGWEIECDNLRIPSTRNWAIVGRRRVTKDSEEEERVSQNVNTIVERVKERGMFKARKPEGHTADH